MTIKAFFFLKKIRRKGKKKEKEKAQTSQLVTSTNLSKLYDAGGTDDLKEQ